MDLTRLMPDHLSELLVKIVEFTVSRRSVLHRNIREIRAYGFIPQDLPVAEFADAVNGALVEHLVNQRLVFRDTANVKFGENGAMSVVSVADARAQALLVADPAQYLEFQVNKLLENSLNRRAAQDLLKLKCSAPSGPTRSYAGRLRSKATRPQDLPTPRQSEE